MEGAFRYGGIDGLILNAGTFEPLCRIADDRPLDDWKKHFDINFFALVTALKAGLPYLRRSTNGGRVVFVSSGAAVKGMVGWAPYSASKAAMNSLCRYFICPLSSLLVTIICAGLLRKKNQMSSLWPFGQERWILM